MEVMVQEARIVNSNVRRALAQAQFCYASSGAWQHRGNAFQNVDPEGPDAFKPLVMVTNLAQEQDMQLMCTPKRSNLGT